MIRKKGHAGILRVYRRLPTCPFFIMNAHVKSFYIKSKNEALLQMDDG